MKAVVIDQYGSIDELTVGDMPRPEITDDQLLVEVHACSVNPIDTKVRDGSMSFRFGKDFPKVLGFDAAGVVCAVGGAVKDFVIGDEVFTRSDAKTGEAMAEYLAVSAFAVAHKPQQLSWQEAAAMPLAGLTALQGLRDDCQLQVGQRVLIIGASGGVGSYAVQIAKAMGAHVTAVCSTNNIELVQSLGADQVIDYSCDPVFSSDHSYDAIFDVVGSQCFSAGRKAMTNSGRYAAAVPSLGVIFGMFIANRFRRQQARFVMCKSSGADLRVLAQWVQQGKLRSVIDTVYTLEEITQAHQKIATKRTRGKLIIVVRP